MPKLNEHIEHLSEEAISKYLGNKLSSKEMHIVEKHLLDCTLCSEAIEGFESFPEIDILESSLVLQKKVQNRTSEKKDYFKLGIAASIALLIAFSFFFLFDFVDNDQEKSITNLQKRQSAPLEKGTQPDSLIADNFSSSNEEFINTDEIVEETKGSSAKQDLKTIRMKRPKTNAQTETKQDELIALAEDDSNYDEEIVLEETAFMDDEVEEVMITDITQDDPVLAPVAEKIKSQGITNEKKASARSSFSTQSENQNKVGQEQLLATPKKVIQGRITDETGDPIPGVNVIVKGTTVGTTSGIDGLYKLDVDSGDDILTFSFIGLNTQEVVIDDQSIINISMDADASELSEVVVTSRSAGRKKGNLGYTESNVKEKSTKAEPVGGYKSYKNYIKTSLKNNYPEEALANDVRGKVKLEMTINEKGEIENLRVIKGLGYGCDEEATRLVLNGPSWVAGKKNGVPTAMTVQFTIVFKLP